MKREEEAANSTQFRNCCACLLALLIFSHPLHTYAGVGKQPAGLTGCEITDLETSPTADLTFLGCSGPFGLYSSTNFGTSWTLAVGGEYEAGSARKIKIGSTNVYALVGRPGTIFKDSTANQIAGTAAWTDIGLTSVGTFDLSGSFIVYGNYTGGVSVVNASTGVTIQTTSVSGVTDVLQIAIDANNGFVYVIGQVGLLRKLFRATFNTSNGSLGTFQSISSASGLPADAHFGVVGFAPPNKLLASARDGADFESTAEFQSLDNGETFTELSVGNFLNDISFSADGEVGIIGNYYTIDGGDTYTFLSRTDNDAPQLQNNAVLINPTNPEIALVKTGLGIAKTTDLVTNSGSPTFTDVNTGVRSSNVISMAQFQTNKDRIIIGLDTGVAYSENFRDSSPSFKNFCPVGACLRSQVALDPVDATRVYAGYGIIYAGTVSDGDIDWESLVSSPETTYRSSRIEVNPASTEQLIVSYQELTGPSEGGLYFYNRTSGATIRQALTIPVSTFIVINSSLMFAAGGYRVEQNPTSATRGLWRSTDGGVTFSKVTDSDFPELLLINAFSYDALNDILYAASENTAADGEQGNGTVYILRKPVTEGATNWTKTNGEFPSANSGSDSSFKGLSIDPAEGHVFVGAQNQIWVSTTEGRTWRLFYEGLEGEDIQVLVYDELTSGGPGGLQAYSGEPPACKRLTVREDIRRNTTKRNVLTTVRGALTSTAAASESVTLQKKAGQTYRTVSTKETAPSGKVSFPIRKNAGRYRLIDNQDQVLCSSR